jgi:predicted nucleic acid-binding protein
MPAVLRALYLDTSCLLKTIIPEPQSARVLSMIVAEPRVVVSGLARLEAQIQIHARRAGGLLTVARTARLIKGLDLQLGLAPFELVDFPVSAIATAEGQLLAPGAATHCRTLDRLHPATMQELGVDRILTSDATQARAARALGFEVLAP